MTLNFVQFHIDTLGPAIDDNAHLLPRIAQAIKNFQRSLGTAYSGNIQRQGEENVIRQIESCDSYRIKRMGKIDHDTLKLLAQKMKNFRDVVRPDLLRLVCFVRGGHKRKLRRVNCQHTGNERLIKALASVSEIRQ